MPPDVREWLPPRHLAWFVIDAVAEMELDAFMRLSGRRALPAALWPGDDWPELNRSSQRGVAGDSKAWK